MNYRGRVLWKILHRSASGNAYPTIARKHDAWRQTPTAEDFSPAIDRWWKIRKGNRRDPNRSSGPARLYETRLTKFPTSISGSMGGP